MRWLLILLQCTRGEIIIDTTTLNKNRKSTFKYRFDAPVQELKRVGPAVAVALARLGIYSIQDLLFHLPIRYQDRTRLATIGALRHGDECSVEGEILATSVQYGKRRMLVSKISDNTGILTLKFFHFSAAQQQNLEPGKRIRCYGEIRRVKGVPEMVHPEYRTVFPDQGQQVAAYLTPVYSTTEGLRQFSIRNLIDQLVIDSHTLTVDVPEYLPQTLLQRYQFPSLAQAIALVHKPPPDVRVAELIEKQHISQRRLVFEELLAHHLVMRKLRARYQVHQAPPLLEGNKLQARLMERLPFQLTDAQKLVLDEINLDLSAAKPMMRLVQGDVGSGKTVVAALAALRAVESGYQVALMAPTELLAYQHYQSLIQWLDPLGIRIEWITGKLKGKAREEMAQSIASGGVQIAVGTHALFQEDIVFEKLAMVIVDEQHRFGVHQRLALRNKGKECKKGRSDDEITESFPHQLIMTATPIPRTLAMTAYADLDCSIISELPPGRLPVDTVVLEERRRGDVIERVYEACQMGKQAYWVCTLIEESEVLQCQAAEETAQRLKEELTNIRVDLIHGRMKSSDKDNVMSRFKAGKVDLLVATTVIEVGVDVANATLMIIENAERLGLAQLHQLRGRVGRGKDKSVCVLLYRSPLSQFAKERLAVMRETNDGFELAQKDLDIRGPGELIGTRQTGLVQFRIADLRRDQELLPGIIDAANTMVINHHVQVQLIIDRWIMHKEDYSNV